MRALPPSNSELKQSELPVCDRHIAVCRFGGQFLHRKILLADSLPAMRRALARDMDPFMDNDMRNDLRHGMGAPLAREAGGCGAKRLGDTRAVDKNERLNRS